VRPVLHPAQLDDDALLAECSVTRGRTGGPGGQNRNKVETLVELTHEATGIKAHASERRSQLENRRVALRRLRLLLAVEHRTPVPAGEIQSDLWKSRRRSPRRDATAGSPPADRWSAGAQGTLAINPDHHDYPALLAEAMNVMAAAGWDVKRASLRLEVSASQLVKLVKDHPPALVRLNHERSSAGLGELK
jgi:RF-1 domain